MDDETMYTGESVAFADEDAAIAEAARKLGEDYGTAGGSWVTDGNSTDETRRAIIQASEDGEFFEAIAPDMSGPLSGEWADGYTLGRLSDELGIDEESDEFPDLCTIFEDAYFQAFEDEAVRSARASLPDES